MALGLYYKIYIYYIHCIYILVHVNHSQMLSSLELISWHLLERNCRFTIFHQGGEDQTSHCKGEQPVRNNTLSQVWNFSAPLLDSLPKWSTMFHVLIAMDLKSLKKCKIAEISIYHEICNHVHFSVSYIHLDLPKNALNAFVTIHVTSPSL